MTEIVVLVIILGTEWILLNPNSNFDSEMWMVKTLEARNETSAKIGAAKGLPVYIFVCDNGI